MSEHYRVSGTVTSRVDRVYRGRFVGIASRFVGGTWKDARASLVEDVIAAEAGKSNATSQWLIAVLSNRSVVRYYQARQRAVVCCLS